MFSDLLQHETYLLLIFKMINPFLLVNWYFRDSLQRTQLIHIDYELYCLEFALPDFDSCFMIFNFFDLIWCFRELSLIAFYLINFKRLYRIQGLNWCQSWRAILMLLYVSNRFIALFRALPLRGKYSGSQISLLLYFLVSLINLKPVWFIDIARYMFLNFGGWSCLSNFSWRFLQRTHTLHLLLLHPPSLAHL